MDLCGIPIEIKIIKNLFIIKKKKKENTYYAEEAVELIGYPKCL